MSESKDPDLLGSIIQRVQEGTADRLERRMQQAGDIKAQEETDSQKRLEGMWLREHERQQKIAEAQAEQRRQEQMLVRCVLIGAVVIILIVIVSSVLVTQLG